VVLLLNHEGLPLARTKSGTLRLAEDAQGLRVDADLEPDDPDVKGPIPKMRRGDLDSRSFAFRCTAQEWNEDRTQRRIKSLSLDRGDISVVTHPANENTSVTLRSAEYLAGGFDLTRSAEQELQLLGYGTWQQRSTMDPSTVRQSQELSLLR
jgi:HK97 family phage prohead protease